ncbi:hypothetical protein QYE76_047506 [Lolium multiflorum]|uniref:Uncharacterized protein n=1 Tax=Lolium multiflorum TaxID=4521 RepID=A0AAD8X217_LOLMU|nr:hypothetical protein QYE76_047506 [Lolium multiflorum]
MAGINVISWELVRPSEATPHGPFWLSNLDLGVWSGYSPMIYLFRPLGVGCPADFFSADILRTALSRALVPFYPLAGRLGMAPDGRLEIDCSYLLAWRRRGAGHGHAPLCPRWPQLIPLHADVVQLGQGAAGDTVPPFLDRSPLRARSPPVILFDHFQEYCRNGAGSATGAARPSELAAAILRVTSAQAAALRAWTGESLFRSLVAHI